MKKFFKVSIIAATLFCTYALGDNPYTFFSGSGSGSNTSTSSSSSSSTTTTNTPSTSMPTPQPVVTTNAPAPAPMTTTVPALTTAPQYVQPASQVGQKGPAPLNFSQTAKGNTAQPAVNTMAQGLGGYGSPPATTPYTTPGTNTNTTPPSSTPFTGGLGASETNYLQQIMMNTGTSQTADQQLLNYWTIPPTNDQLMGAVSGYSAVSNLSAQDSTAASLAKSALALPNVTMNAGAAGSDPLNGISYLEYVNSASGNNPVNKVWNYAVNQAVFDIAASQKQMDAMHDAVVAPFGGQANWSAQVQSASAPQLLRMLVVEQAMQNYMMYQSLQRQADQELMQAATLRMLAEVNNSISNANDAQISQLKRVAQAIQDLKGNGK